MGLQLSSTTNKKHNRLTTIDLYGNSYEIGFKHGNYLKAPITEIITGWKKEVENFYNENFELVIDSFFAKTNYVQCIEKVCPWLLEEVKGIADGAGLSYKTILAFQMSEELEFSGKRLLHAKCTSICKFKDSESGTLLAQNMDPPLFLHGYPTLLIIRTNDLSINAIYTVPGLIGLCGLNNDFGITCNGISMLNGQSYGIPVAFLVRFLLQQKNEEKSYKILETVKHATPQCYTIAGKNNFICFECSANKISKCIPFRNRNKSFIIHTNHSLINKDYSQDYKALLTRYGKTTEDILYYPRYEKALDIIKENNNVIDIELIKQILKNRDNPNNPISNDFTYGSLIMEFRDTTRLHISPGQPHIFQYTTIELK